MALFAYLSADRSTVHLRGRSYRGQFPADQIDQQIKFYKRLVEKSKGGPFYEPTLKSLLTVKQQMETQK